MENQNVDYRLSMFPRAWEDIQSYTIPALWHYKVLEVLVKEGDVMEAGAPLLTLEILKDERSKSSTRSTQSDTTESLQSKVVSHDESAPANKKQKVNDNGQTKKVTLIAHRSCLVAEVLVKKGMEVKPSEPMYALKLPDTQDLSKEGLDQLLLYTKKLLDKLDETNPLPAMTDKKD